MSGAASTGKAAIIATAFEPLSIGEVAQRIVLIRGQRVVLDTDLAAFYGETTKRFNQQVSRNRAWFPEDFMFQLSAEEVAALRLQSATLKTGRGQHRKFLPWAFTEHGALMASAEVLKRMAEIDRTLLEHDQSLQFIWRQIEPLLNPPDPQRPKIGFQP